MRMLLLQRHDGLHRETLMHMAATLPQQHLSARSRVDVAAQVVVGAKDDALVPGQLVYNLLRIAARHHHIGQRLHSRRRVHIAHHGVAGMLIDERLQVVGLATVGQRAASVQVGAQHLLLWRQQLARLGHEVHTRHHNDVGVGLRSLSGQRKRVAHKVGHLLNVARGVVVGQQHRVLLLAQTTNLLLQIYRLINVALFQPFFFQHSIIISFIFFIFKKYLFVDDDMSWIC